MVETVIFIVVMLLTILLVLLCFICGFKFRQGKWLMLIAGYNEFDEETRNKMDSDKIGKEAGNISIATGLFIILIGILIWLSNHFTFFEKNENMLLLILGPTAIFIYFVLKKVKESNDYYKKFRK